MFVLADLNTERRSHTLPYFADPRFDYVSANVSAGAGHRIVGPLGVPT